MYRSACLATACSRSHGARSGPARSGPGSRSSCVVPGRMRINDPVSPAILLRSLPRAFDDLPIWAQLNITWKCNLDCAYCSEYDNSRDHVPYDALVARIDKIQSLGTLHCDLIG